MFCCAINHITVCNNLSIVIFYFGKDGSLMPGDDPLNLVITLDVCNVYDRYVRPKEEAAQRVAPVPSKPNETDVDAMTVDEDSVEGAPLMLSNDNPSAPTTMKNGQSAKSKKQHGKHSHCNCAKCPTYAVMNTAHRENICATFMYRKQEEVNWRDARCEASHAERHRKVHGGDNDSGGRKKIKKSKTMMEGTTVQESKVAGPNTAGDEGKPKSEKKKMKKMKADKLGSSAGVDTMDVA
ncbi:hypothetical protein PUNSTDRAFT_42001 [Punctularia strigosozonata HHB-11173 SS5]|uniref:uncharacterized protein n=1 Tax=Punctularia strigosozonata (strain HHB-11173) TaxID=741275 RepID=UPI0004417F5A|nr:uncharacterized protein PUNSTDRAFT_42001 [Punctularia strigosozonata HHB-11173 SS5]EIN12359.1 hypothetical protein PUNSTDRAFT_42001 [Punctularia strigosozonata HHB-11173 SS5]